MSRLQTLAFIFILMERARSTKPKHCHLPTSFIQHCKIPKSYTRSPRNSRASTSNLLRPPRDLLEGSEVYHRDDRCLKDCSRQGRHSRRSVGGSEDTDEAAVVFDLCLRYAVMTMIPEIMLIMSTLILALSWHQAYLKQRSRSTSALPTPSQPPII